MPLKKIIYILFFCSLILPFHSIISQVTEPVQQLSNISIFDNELKKIFLKIENKLIITGKDKVYDFNINGTEEQKDFFINGVRKFLSDYKIIFGDSSAADFFVNIENLSTAINYKDANFTVVLDKKLNRNLVLSFNFKVKDRARNEIIDSGFLTESYDDVISYDDVPNAESSNYSFTKGKLPKQPASEKFLIPGIVILVSAVAIILFFTIRSK
jgi:uncharacterized ubiquitin-like protein YukD